MKAKLPLTEGLIDLAAHRFRLLGEPMRLRILQALEAGERSVTDLTRVVSSNQPNVSRHLQALHEGGIVKRRRDGNTIYYAIADPVVFQICELVCRSAVDVAQARLGMIMEAAGPARKEAARKR